MLLFDPFAPLMPRNDRELVVRGRRTRPELEEGSTWAHAERPFGAFERRVQLPEAVDADAITANMDAGVLSLIVPKPDRLTPKSIPIKSTTQLETNTA